MFLKQLFRRIVFASALITIILVAIAYGVGHLSRQSLIVAYGSSTDPAIYGYFVDPMRQFNVPIRIPQKLVSAPYLTASNEPYHIFTSKGTVSADTGSYVQRLYRYNFRTQSIDILYETLIGENILSASDSALQFNGYFSAEDYIVIDKVQHAIILVNRNTLDRHVLWQGTQLSEIGLNYSLTVTRSPSGDTYTVNDSSQVPRINVVSKYGEIINR